MAKEQGFSLFAKVLLLVITGNIWDWKLKFLFGLNCKSYFWQNYSSWYVIPNTLGQSDCRSFRLKYLKNHLRYQVAYLDVVRYPLKLQ